MDFRGAFEGLPVGLQDKIGEKCPQIKIREYGYEFVWGGKDRKIVNINGRNYEVKKTAIEEMMDLLEHDDCKRLRIGKELQDKIFGYYERILGDEKELRRALEDGVFRYVYEMHRDGRKMFEKMEWRYSVVVSFVMYLYHYN